MCSRVTNNFDRFALSRLSKCNFAYIFIFYVLLDIMMQCITLILLFSKFFVHFLGESHDKTHKKEALERITTFHFHQGETSVIKQ